MGLIFPAPKLEPGEQVAWSGRAQRCERTAWAGTLVLTQTRLVFTPTRLGAPAPVSQYPLRDCVRIETVERTGTPYDGGMRRRIRLVLADGTSALFVVKHTDETAAFLNDAIRNAHPA